MPTTETQRTSTFKPVATAIFALTAVAWLASAAAASPITLFTTGSPDGRIGTLSQPAGGGLPETETADDFILGQDALITGATITGVVPLGTTLASLQAADLEIGLYHIFPVDSGTFDSRVPTRVNSPSDNEFAAFDTALGTISAVPTILNSNFTVANSVVSGIHPFPGQQTGGEGAVTGEEVQFAITFNTPFLVGGTDHDFFSPEVGLSSGDFLWLSAGTPSAPDLQAWIRNTSLDPDWLRIGTDIIGGVTPPRYDMSFSLVGNPVSAPVPEPTTLTLTGLGVAGLVVRGRRRRRQAAP